jgi:hypothetical protein
VYGAPAKVAYLVNGQDDTAALALCDWLREGLRVHVAAQPLKLDGTTFPRGSLVVKVRDNPETLPAAMHRAAKEHGLRIHGTSTAFVEEGAGLGGPNVRWVKPPRVLMLVDRPASYGVGHTWYLFDQVWRYPVTRVAGRLLGAVDLRKYDVLILPDGGYGADTDAPSETTVTRIREWVKSGGTLIAVKGAAAWAAGEKVKLLAGKPAKADGEKPGPAKEPTPRAPGVFLRAAVYDDHWVTFGMKETTAVHYSGNLILMPLKRGEGRNLVTFAEGERLLASGFCWPETLKALGGKPYLVHQPLGSGHVIGFADDPNFRAMYPEAQRLFLNAVLLGPGHSS